MSYPTWSDLNNPSIVPPLGARQAPNLGGCGLLVSTEPDLRFLANSVGGLKTQPFFMGTLMTENKGHGGICIAGPYMGSPYGVMLLESLIARGVKKILVVGWCGAVSKDLGPGDMVVPTQALVDEGTSHHYLALEGDPPIVSPDNELSDLLASHLAECGESAHRLPIWTTDAIYRETPDKVSWYRNKGARAVEMECSALFAVAQFRKVPIAALLVVSDSLAAESGWDPGFKKKKFKAARLSACRAAVAMARKIVE